MRAVLSADSYKYTRPLSYIVLSLYNAGGGGGDINIIFYHGSFVLYFIYLILLNLIISYIYNIVKIFHLI